jgi:hypothetical protein
MVSRPKGLMGRNGTHSIRDPGRCFAERNALREAKTKLLADAQSGRGGLTMAAHTQYPEPYKENLAASLLWEM